MSTQQSDLRLFTLLYIDDSEIWSAGIGTGKLAFKDVYLRCASKFSESCAKQGVRLEILTNEPFYVNEQLAKLNRPQIAVGMNFDRDVPRGIPFYAAHFKLDVIRQLGTGNFGGHVGLVDNDVVMLKAPAIDFTLWRDDCLFVYDITQTVFEEYGKTLVKADLERVACARIHDVRWYGGEFIAGSSAAFQTLSKCVDFLWPAYQSTLSTLHHIGDEIIVSAALNILAEGKKIIAIDVGSKDYRWVSRWFSSRTMFHQMPLSYHSESIMLHLPADKRFIADSVSESFNSNVFISKYKIHAARKLLLRRVLNRISVFKQGVGRQISRLS